MALETIPCFGCFGSHRGRVLLAFIVWSSLIYYLHILSSRQFGNTSGEQASEGRSPGDTPKESGIQEEGLAANSVVDVHQSNFMELTKSTEPPPKQKMFQPTKMIS